MPSTSAVIIVSLFILVAALIGPSTASESNSTSSSVDAPMDNPAELELVAGLSTLEALLRNQEKYLSELRSNVTDPLRSMSVILQSYVSLTSLVRQQTNDSEFLNSQHLELLDIVMTEVLHDLSNVTSLSCNESVNATSNEMNFSSQAVESSVNPVDSTVWVMAVSLPQFVSDLQKKVSSSLSGGVGVMDDQWPANHVQDEHLLRLLCIFSFCDNATKERLGLDTSN